MKTSSSASTATNKNASKPSQKKPDVSSTKAKSNTPHTTSRSDEQPASTVILDATPLRPAMLQRLAVIAIIMSGLAIAVSLYPVLRPVVAPVLGLAIPAPEWQSDIAALSKKETEYRASADAERAQLLTMMTVIEKKIEAALSDDQSVRETLSSLRNDITELKRRLDFLEDQKNVALFSSEAIPDVSKKAESNRLAGNSESAPENSSGAEKSRPSLWEEWTSGRSLSGALDYLGKMLNLTRLDEAPSS